MNHRQIKVCHMTSVHSSDDARVFHKMCVSLAEAGYETYLVSPGESHIDRGVRVLGVGEKPGSRVKRMLSFSGSVYEKARSLDADIYHVHDPELLMYGMRLKRLGKKVVYDCHEDYTKTILESPWMPTSLRGIAVGVYTAIEKRISPMLDAVICVTQKLYERFRKYGADTHIILNYPIVDSPGSASIPYYARNRKLCFTGGIVPERLHENIISVLATCDAQYILVGPAAEDYLGKLEALNGWENVIYKGRLPFDEIPALIRSCAVGVALHDYTESMNGHMGTLGVTKLFEYMQCGLPVVCTDFILWKDIIEIEKCGLCVDPTDTSALASAVQYLLDHPDEAAQMGQNGRRAVLEKYNWQTQEQKLLDLYEQLLPPCVD